MHTVLQVKHVVINQFIEHTVIPHYLVSIKTNIGNV